MDVLKNRVIMLANYICENKATVRSTAKEFSVSKSTVHKDVTQRLKKYNYALYNEVQKVINLNKSERHLRGGLATKQKYLEKKHNENSNLQIQRNKHT